MTAFSTRRERQNWNGEGDSLCGTRGSWELSAVAEPFRAESPRSHDRSERRPDALEEPKGHFETFYDSSGIGPRTRPGWTRSRSYLAVPWRFGANTRALPQVFREGHAAALRPASLCLNCCRIRDSHEKWKDMACSSECVCFCPRPVISSVDGQCLLCGNTWRRTDLCVSSGDRQTVGY